MKVVVIVPCGFHLGYLGCYGNDWVQTPGLDRLAAEGVVFDQHYADRPDAAGAQAAWRRGRYHFPVPEDGEGTMPARADLVQLLRGGRVGTSLVIDGNRPFADEFAVGWEHVTVVSSAGGGSILKRTLEVAGEALDRLAARDQWLLWVELSTLLPPWDVPEDFLEPYFQPDTADEEDEAAGAEDAPGPLPDPPAGLLEKTDVATLQRLQNTYAAAVSYFDAGLGALLDDLQARGLDEQVAVLLTTDRGAALGEHRVVGEEHPWLHDELIHVPLLVRLPGQAEAGRRVSALTQPVDLLPTLLELFGLPPAPVHGHSLLPLLRAEGGPTRAYAAAGLRVGEAVEWALRTPQWGLVLPLRPSAGDPDRGPQLYVKPDDRWEVNNVIQHHPVLVEHLEAVLRGFVAATRQPGPFQPPVLRNVEAGNRFHEGAEP
ncbi:MAG TPA: sulfatase-like hydrolase/transferase [Gemmataceae bacterium]|jgi:arylsulfatase A-like enzyme|nr:sulfatase-like hydrolase/transferase [Gemmataceae bacterium]